MNADLPLILFDGYRVLKEAEKEAPGITAKQVAAVLDVVVRHARNDPAPAAVPEGYVLVPKEPTVEMINAGYNAQWRVSRVGISNAWDAMLAAAQKEGK